MYSRPCSEAGVPRQAGGGAATDMYSRPCSEAGVPRQAEKCTFRIFVDITHQSSDRRAVTKRSDILEQNPSSGNWGQ
jgi:hypothetical protein